MRVKLAILERDIGYLNRLMASFAAKYADKLQIYSFTNYENAISTVISERVEVFLANDSFDIEFDKIPDRCSFAYFVDAPDIEMLNDQRTICKFQKADLIYRQILSVYSEKAGNLTGSKLGEEGCATVCFASVSGGSGTSSMSAACCMHLAKKGSKVLYLNFEKFGSPDVFFSADGQFDMSDIIFAVKSKKANLSMKLESCVKQDNSGVFFFSQSKVALDMFELNNDDILKLINELKISGSYDCVVIDIPFDKDTLKIVNSCDSIVVVGDGSDTSNMKIYRAYNALKTMESNDDSLRILSKTSLVYNKFSNKTSKAIDNIELKALNGAPKYEHATTQQVVAQLASLDVFDKIIG